MHRAKMRPYQNLISTAVAAPCTHSSIVPSAPFHEQLVTRSLDDSLGYNEEQHKGIIPDLNKQIFINSARCDKLNYSSNMHEYVGIREVGRGGMGTVLLAAHAHPSLHSLVAIKAIKIKDGANLKGLNTELEVLSLVGSTHPFLPRLHAHFVSESYAFMVMDYCSGGDLNMLRQRQADRRLSEAAIRFYAAELVLALEHLHGLGFVYRDLKPENVLISDTGHVVLTDFDLSLRLTSSQDVVDQDTCSHCATASPANTSQLNADADAATVRAQAMNIGTVVQRPNRLLSCFTVGSMVAPEADGIDSATPARKELQCSNVVPDRQNHIADYLQPKPTVATELNMCWPRCRNKNVGAVPTAMHQLSWKVCTKARMSWQCKGKKSAAGSVDEQQKASARGADMLAARRRCRHFVGTEEYVAPEVIRGEGYSYAVDWWALGVLLYELMLGRTPFKGRDRKRTFYNIVEQEVALPGAACDPLRDMLKRLLVKDPRQRLARAEDVKAHLFFEGIQWELLQHMERPPFLPLMNATSIMSSSNLAQGCSQLPSLESFLREPPGPPSFSSSSTSSSSASTSSESYE